MLEIKLALDIIITSALEGVDGILVVNMNGCELEESYGISIGSYQVDLVSVICKGWLVGNIKWDPHW